MYNDKNMIRHFLSCFETTVRQHWDVPALSDYDGTLSLTFGELATEMLRLQTLFEALGLQKGDKVAVCGGNCVNWALSFLSVAAYEGVVVSILPDFRSENIRGLVKHSDARLLIVGQKVWDGLKRSVPDSLTAVLSLNDFGLLAAANADIKDTYSRWDSLFAQRCPGRLGPDDVHYPVDNLDNLCLINYTAGTTSDPKGVMLTYGNLSSNIQYGRDRIPLSSGCTVLSLLPLAHMFGLTFECLYPVVSGAHAHFMNRTPSLPRLLKAFADVKPYMVISVPLIVEKIYKNTVSGRSVFAKKKNRRRLMTAFGGRLEYLIIGGAALPEKTERGLRSIRFPYTVGYGMTECGPLITYQDWRSFKKYSCGRVVDRMQLKVDSSWPRRIPGEILVRGANVMQGYYKNPTATKVVMTDDGWMRTGDMGIVDKKGNLFIKGCCKNMILGTSGQNIYPEEIEEKLNAMPLVMESIVLQRQGRLIALVYPDYENSSMPLDELMEQYRTRLNKGLPYYSQIQKIELMSDEFEKTPKQNIRRYLYR